MPLDPSSSYPYTNYCVKEGNLHFSYVLEHGLLGKRLVITPKKSKLKMLNRKFCLSKNFSGNCLSKRQAGWLLPVLTQLLNKPFRAVPFKSVRGKEERKVF